MSSRLPQKIEMQILWHLSPWHYGEPYQSRLIGTLLRNILFQPLLVWLFFKKKSLLPLSLHKIWYQKGQILLTFEYSTVWEVLCCTSISSTPRHEMPMIPPNPFFVQYFLCVQAHVSWVLCSGSCQTEIVMSGAAILSETWIPLPSLCDCWQKSVPY